MGMKGIGDGLSQGIRSVYLGGGTPSLLEAGQVEGILGNFRYGIRDTTEITLEMNPQ